MASAVAPTPTLPPEILIQIFELVYTSISPVQYIPQLSITHLRCTIPGCGDIVRKEGQKCANGHTVYKEPGMEDIFSPALFPHSLAAVCTDWRDAMSLSQEFWTRIVVVLDSFTASSPRALREDLEWSRMQLIDFIIVRRRDPHIDMSKDVELARVQQVLDVLRPHLKRCRSLSIFVDHTSSLISISPTFLASMTYSTCVLLQATTDSGPGQAWIPVQPHVHGDLKSSKWHILRDLELDGWNCARLCKLHPSRVKKILISCTTLTITHGGGNLPWSRLMVFLKAVLNLKRLRLDRVTFTGAKTLEKLDITHLDLLFLSAELTSAVLSSCNPVSELRVVGCPTGIVKINSSPWVLRASDLVLEEIEESYSIENIIRIWNGVRLSVYSCPGFDDRILTLIGKGFPNNLAVLRVEDCHNFSVQAGKKIVNVCRSMSVRILLNMNDGIGSSEESNWITDRIDDESTYIDNRSGDVASPSGNPPPRHRKRLVLKSVRAVSRFSSWFICSTTK